MRSPVAVAVMLLCLSVTLEAVAQPMPMCDQLQLSAAPLSWAQLRAIARSQGPGPWDPPRPAPSSLSLGSLAATEGDEAPAFLDARVSATWLAVRMQAQTQSDGGPRYQSWVQVHRIVQAGWLRSDDDKAAFFACAAAHRLGVIVIETTDQRLCGSHATPCRRAYLVGQTPERVLYGDVNLDTALGSMP